MAILADKVTKIVSKLVNVKSSETRALAWSWLYVFALFVAYYVLRPIRDELGVAGGIKNLPWLFSGTLLVMLLMNPVFGALVKHYPREKFIAYAYRFFSLNLIIFLLLLNYASPEQQIWIGRAFFIWVSVFNLFVVSVFWSLIVDVFNTEQGKRLFGFLAAGATTGGIAGSALTASLVTSVGQNWLLFGAIILLEIATLSAGRLVGYQRDSTDKRSNAVTEEGKDSGIFAGLTHTFRSPYLMGIAGFVMLYTITSTFLYYEQANIAQNVFSGRAERTAFFANIDLWVNCITLIFQLFFTGRLTQWLGLIAVLCILPVLSIVGFAALAFWPSLTMFIALQVARRVSNFALARPSREVLFTLVPREDRYKAKNFIDTVVYRGGDQIGSWAYAGLAAIGLTASGVALAAIPVSVIWLMIGGWLGWHQKKQKRSLALTTDSE